MIDVDKVFNTVRPMLIARNGMGFTSDEIAKLNAVLGVTTPAAVKPEPRLTLARLHDKIGIAQTTPGYGESFGPRSKTALRTYLTNTKPPALTQADITLAAASLGVGVNIINAIRKVEAPRGAFDNGMLTMLYERHVFARNTDPKGRFNASNPDLSAARGYGPGGYGTYAGQFDRLASACALDPEAAFRACSWGAFQVLGENAVACGYASAFDMVSALMVSEAAHLDSFVRFVRMKGLEDELRACRAGDPDSCIPFVRGYNGEGFRQYDYHTKLAKAAAS